MLSSSLTGDDDFQVRHRLCMTRYRDYSCLKDALLSKKSHIIFLEFLPGERKVKDW
jgi:hypothetical protein